MNRAGSPDSPSRNCLHGKLRADQERSPVGDWLPAGPSVRTMVGFQNHSLELVMRDGAVAGRIGFFAAANWTDWTPRTSMYWTG